MRFCEYSGTCYSIRNTDGTESFQAFLWVPISCFRSALYCSLYVH